MADPRAFVCGMPVRHSRSPLIHSYWLRELGLPGSYEAVEVAPAEAPAFFASLAERGFAGGNVTIPHKETAFAAVSRRDAAAEAIGAVNTLWFENGQLVGGNTDSFGFAANLDDRLPGWQDAGRAVILGAGGASRAVVHALLSRGVRDIRILNRTRARADELALRFGASVTAHGWSDAASELAAADLVVNTTALGMAGHEGEGAMPDLDVLPAHALVTDIVYVPLMTPFLLAAKARGLRHADGLGMLLHQAAPGFAHWFGRTPAVSPSLRAAVIADMEARP